MSLDALQRLVLERAAPPGDWRGDHSVDDYDWQLSSMVYNIRVRFPLREVHDEAAGAFADAVATRDAIIGLGFVLHSRCELAALGVTTARDLTEDAQEDDPAILGWRGYLDLGLRQVERQ